MEEFTEPSTPPKKYRNLTNSGHIYICIYSGSDCIAGFGTTDSYPWPSATDIVYDSATCAVTGGIASHYSDTSATSCSYSETGSHDFFGYAPGPTGPAHESTPSGNGFFDRTPTTFQESYGLGVCVPAGSFFLTTWGSHLQTLSVEDTEDDAIARSNATIPDWVALNSGNCLSNSAFIARGDTRFDFTYRSEQTKATVTGLTIGATYTIVIRFGSRAVGSTGPFIANGLTEVTFTAEHVTDSTDWIDVPNENNMETIPTGCTVRSGG